MATQAASYFSGVRKGETAVIKVSGQSVTVVSESGQFSKTMKDGVKLKSFLAEKFRTDLGAESTADAFTDLQKRAVKSLADSYADDYRDIVANAGKADYDWQSELDAVTTDLRGSNKLASLAINQAHKSAVADAKRKADGKPAKPAKAPKLGEIARELTDAERKAYLALPHGVAILAAIDNAAKSAKAKAAKVAA